MKHDEEKRVKNARGPGITELIIKNSLSYPFHPFHLNRLLDPTCSTLALSPDQWDWVSMS